MERIVIRHLSGSKANQIEEFPLSTTTTLVIGRDPAAAVKFDPDSDDLVSRQHARIERDPAQPGRFRLTDLGSRNGTFVNRERITAPVELHVGDVIQLGAGGPDLQFDLEPRPADALKATRVGTVAEVAATRIGPTVPTVATPPSTETPGSEVGRVSVGRTTVERMIEAQTQRSRLGLAGGIAAVLALLALVGAYAIYSGRQERTERATDIGRLEATRAAESAARAVEQAEHPLTPREITDRFADAVVLVEVSWKLLETGSGKQLFHRYVKGVPAYVQLPDRIYPMLADSDEKGTNAPIGGKGSGTGFVVTENGFILTNRHVANSWLTRYDLDLSKGVVFSLTASFFGRSTRATSRR